MEEVQKSSESGLLCVATGCVRDFADAPAAIVGSSRMRLSTRCSWRRVPDHHIDRSPPLLPVLTILPPWLITVKLIISLRPKQQAELLSLLVSCLPLASNLKMETCSSETSVDFERHTQCYLLDNTSPQSLLMQSYSFRRCFEPRGCIVTATREESELPWQDDNGPCKTSPPWQTCPFIRMTS
jgi:hypothetical protein